MIEIHGTPYATLHRHSAKQFQFLLEALPPGSAVEVVRVPLCHVGTRPHYALHLSFPAPRGSTVAGSVKIVVDPTYKRNPGAIDYKREEGSVPIDLLLHRGDEGVKFEVGADTFPGQDTIYVLRPRKNALP